MKKIALLLISILFLSGCTSTEKKIDRLSIANQYYEALHTADSLKMVTLLADSVIVRQTEYDYEEVFTKDSYANKWLQWDAEFQPKYMIEDIQLENQKVKAIVSKVDKRINFLHKAPIVTKEVLHFSEGKIDQIETEKYLIFDDSIFVQRRDSLVNWIKNNHPELDGFIYDQTVRGAKNYLKAIELYNTKSN